MHAHVYIDMLLLLLHNHHAVYSEHNTISCQSSLPLQKARYHLQSTYIGIHAFECFKSLSGTKTSAKH